MAGQGDVRRIALSLPGARSESGRFAFCVEVKGKQKGFVWSWLERVEPRKPRVERADVVAVRVRDLAEKAALLAGDPEAFFSEPHYDGFPAVLVRLPAVTSAQLRRLIVDAWRCQAPRHLVEDAAAPPGKRRVSARPPGPPRAARRGPRAGRRRPAR